MDIIPSTTICVGHKKNQMNHTHTKFFHNSIPFNFPTTHKVPFSVFSQLESAPLEGREESIWPGIMGIAGLPEWEPLPELASSTLMVGVVGGSRAPEGV